MDIGIFTAAVADFAPHPFGKDKFKKKDAGEEFTLRFSKNADILRTLATSRKEHQKVVGFAAETQNLEQAVLDKLRDKKADMIVGNYVNEPGAGFGSPTNTVYIADTKGRRETLSVMPKTDLAWRILDCLLPL